MTKMPELRFAGFDGEWEENTLGKLNEFSKGKGYSKNDLSDEGNPIFLYGQMYTDYKMQINELKTYVKSIKSSSVLSIGNEVLIPTSGETALDLARASHMNMAGVILGGDLNILTPCEKISPHFEALTLSTEKNRKNLSKLAQGKSVVHLYGSDIKKDVISYPDIKEQEDIGDLFSKIDQLIESQQELVDQTIAFKKSMLQKMFPKKDSIVPEFRFDEFKDNWMPVQLSKIGKTVTGNTPSTKNNLYWNDKPDNIWVTPTDIDGPTIYNSERYLTELGLGKSRYLPENSVLITSIASIGKNTINIVPVSINQQINAIIPSNHSSYFILQAMNNSKNRFESLAGNSATKIINKSTFDRFEIIVPCLEEQEKIGNFFKKLDEKIAREEKLLDAYRDMKKSLLQKMFV
ncbi:EcoKI restriction-modification system protein HsdS [Anaerococcus octavius]|uniref:EcoKI restriction-modification system protein HsdS n=1 Tax=Anaerococcus octavius TaxID=54007 RepID=A0A380WT69_9FIRM|nr:restriction endonuclease subunit S [Anaerococcus octavius]SUU92069.1 EcoKI restriction-modification system protein HsdS [Anaerococcus octavius]